MNFINWKPYSSECFQILFNSSWCDELNTPNCISMKFKKNLNLNSCTPIAIQIRMINRSNCLPIRCVHHEMKWEAFSYLSYTQLLNITQLISKLIGFSDTNICNVLTNEYIFAKQKNTLLINYSRCYFWLIFFSCLTIN